MRRLRMMIEQIEGYRDHPDAETLAGAAWSVWSPHAQADGPALAMHLDTQSLLLRLGGIPIRGMARRAGDLRKMLAGLPKPKRAPLRLVTEDEEGPPLEPDVAELPAVPGYRVTGAGVWQLREEPPHLQVCAAPLAVVGLARDAGSGVAHLTLRWKHAGQWVERTVERGVAFDGRKLVGLADHGLPVGSVSAGDVVRYLMAAEAALKVPAVDASSVLGWHSGGRFLWGTTTIGGTSPIMLVADPGGKQLADSFRSGGTMDGWRALWRCAESHPRLVLAVYASVAACLLGVIPESKPFVLDYSGVTSTGKSTAMRLAASVWGFPEGDGGERSAGDMIANWSSTMSNIERRAAMSRNLPTFLDDTKQVRNPDDVTRVLYNIVAATGRGRATATGMQATVSLRTILISTGERPAVSFAHDAGAKARTMSLRGQVMRGGDNPTNGALSSWMLGESIAHYGHLGPLIVKYLSERQAEWPAMRQWFTEFREAYRPGTPGSGVLGRASDYLALLKLAGVIIEAAAGLKYHEAALEEAQAAVGEGAAGADNARAALEHLVDYLHAHAIDVYRAELGSSDARKAPDRPIGRWDEGEPPSILPSIAKRVLEDGGYSLDEVIGVWREREWLVVGSDKRARVQRRLGSGPKAWLLGFTHAAMEAIGAEE